MKFYFILQFKRIYRHIDEFGVIPILGFLGIGFLFILMSNMLFDKIEYAPYVYICIALGLLSKLATFQRNTGLKQYFSKRDHRKVRILENILFSIPFITFLSYREYYLYAIILSVLAILTSFYNKINISSVIIPTPFGKKPFEFVIGFRKTFWVFPIIYVLTYIAVAVNNYNIGIFALLATYLICMSYYSKPEPLYYVWIHATSPKIFLIEKLKTAITYSSFLTAPIVLTLLIMFPVKTIEITLVFVFLGISFLTLSILGKYSNYPSQIPLLEILAMLLCVMLPPLVLLMVPFFYKRAKKNLKTYLSC